MAQCPNKTLTLEVVAHFEIPGAFRFCGETKIRQAATLIALRLKVFGDQKVYKFFCCTDVGHVKTGKSYVKLDRE